MPAVAGSERRPGLLGALSCRPGCLAPRCGGVGQAARIRLRHRWHLCQLWATRFLPARRPLGSWHSACQQLSTTREGGLCQYCDFAAQGPQIGPYAVTVSLLKVNSPYRSVNSCERAVRTTGFIEQGHLLSCREFGDTEEENICRS